jgi:hypothetical protein
MATIASLATLVSIVYSAAADPMHSPPSRSKFAIAMRRISAPMALCR